MSQEGGPERTWDAKGESCLVLQLWGSKKFHVLLEVTDRA
jgi:hypothetical protein